MVRDVSVDPNRPKRCLNCGYGLGQFGVEFCEEYCSLDCFTSAKVTGRIYLADPNVNGKTWQAKPWPRGLVLEAPPSPKPWRARTGSVEGPHFGRNRYSRNLDDVYRFDGGKRMQARLRPSDPEKRPDSILQNSVNGYRGPTVGSTSRGGNYAADGDHGRNYGQYSGGRDDDGSVDVPGARCANRHVWSVNNGDVLPVAQSKYKSANGEDRRDAMGDGNRRGVSSDQAVHVPSTVSRQRAPTTRNAEPQSIGNSSTTRRQCAAGVGTMPPEELGSSGGDSETVVSETATSDERSHIPEETAQSCRIVRPTARASSTRQAVRQWRHLFLP